MKQQVPIVYFYQSNPNTQFIQQYSGEDTCVKSIAKALNIDSHHLRFKIYIQDKDPKMYAWFDISNGNAKCPIISDTIYVKILELDDINYSKISKKILNQNNGGSRIQSQNANNDITTSVPQQQQQETIQVQQQPQIIKTSEFKQQQEMDQYQQKQQQQQQQSGNNFLTPPQQQQQINSSKNLQFSNQSIEDSQNNNNILEAFEDLDYQPKFTKSQPISQLDLEKEIQLQQQKEQKQQKSQDQKNKQQVNLLGDFIYEDKIEEQFDSKPPSIKKLQDDSPYKTDKEIIEQRVNDKAKELRDQWEVEEQYNQLRQKAKDELEQKIQKWAYRDNVRNNIRLLLTTLNDVLWDVQDGWQCSIGDLMTDGKLKHKYMTAIRIVHPDKSQTCESYQQRYIAERVFYELNQAWNQRQK